MAQPAASPGAVSPCCYQHAVSEGAVFCGECGKPLLRCMAFQECGGLLGDDGRCSICVRPQLFLDKDAVTDVKAGGVLVLPLVFYNASSIARPLFITNVWVREGDGQRRKLEMPWKRLDAGGSNTLSVQTGAMERQGRHSIEIIFAAATNYTSNFPREERFAFASSLSLEVEQGGSLVINQTINTQGAGQGSDTVYAPIRLETTGERRRPGDSGGAYRKGEPVELGLQRADSFETTNDVRGYSSGPLQGAVVSRGARIVWKGFAKGDTPSDGPIVTRDSMLGLGRALTKADGGENEVRLLVTNSSGGVDEQLSLTISRRHMEFYFQNGRLYVRARGQAGLLIGEERLVLDGEKELTSGDIIKVLPKYPDALALQVRMRAYYGQIDEITITRIPPMPEASR